MADIVNVPPSSSGQVRATFTSSEVGNGNSNDSNTMANQDGGLAVRLQDEASDGTVTGPVTRYSDEDILFVAGAGTTFDVRDLVIGVQRGDLFRTVALGTLAADTLTGTGEADYVNAGQGGDTVNGGVGNDFLVGGAGDDTLNGGADDDSFIGGGGADTISGGVGDDTAIFNLSTDGADAVDLGTGSDRVLVNSATPGQVRLSFTSAEVGNNNPNDADTLANQDGGLAVRLQAENGSDGLTGPITRTDDEGITFVGGAGVTFDVRDLVSGVQRGDLFRTATLGTQAGDTFTGTGEADYINAGQGADTLNGGDGDDFLVGGAGDDGLSGGDGDDSFIGGGGADSVRGRGGNDTAIINLSTDGADTVDLGVGLDNVLVNNATAGQVRLSFTSAEVGNENALDANTLANQDGGLAVRLQAENGSDGLTGPVTRVDDEGITFVGGAGVTFDVRDLVSGVQRGDLFRTATLGTIGDNTFTGTDEADYVNAGQGNDTLNGGTGDDFLVGGAGNDRLDGSLGADGLLGGGGNDTFVVDDAGDRVIEAVGGGSDEVAATTSYVLAAGQEIELLRFASDYQDDADLTGNEFGQTLSGNAGDNVLDGRGGADTLAGGNGNDTYRVDNSGDEVVESNTDTGIDTVLSSVSFSLAGRFVENLTLTGANAINGKGNTLANSIAGNDAANTFDGGFGADILTGNGGADTFQFRTALGSGNVDRIADFSVADDTIELSQSVFSALTTGTLSASAFKNVSTDGPADADDRILYSSKLGTLSYDADGSGGQAAVQFAVLTNKAALTADDFLIV